MLQAVIFDLDNTLIDWRDTEMAWLETARHALAPVREYLASEGLTLPDPEGFLNTFIMARDQVWEDARTNDWFAPTLTHHFTRTLELLNLPSDDSLAGRMAERFEWGPVRGARLFDDARDSLVAIKRSGIRLGLLTNASFSMSLRDRELEVLGIRGLFDVRLASSDIGEAKPRPLPFLVMLDQLGSEKTSTVFIGDSLEQDIAGCQAVGIRSVWVAREQTVPHDGKITPRPDAIAFSLAQALEIIDIWYPDWRTYHG